jgi:hypothetical protein
LPRIFLFVRISGFKRLSGDAQAGLKNMKTKHYLLAAVLLVRIATAASAAPFISEFWLAGKAQTTNDTPHYYQAGSFSVSSGALVYFKVIATGSFPLSYQWRFYGTNLPGATCSGVTTCTLGFPGTNLPAGDYSVVITDGSSLSVTSQVATLTVDTTFTKITTDPIVNTPDYALGGNFANYVDCDTNPAASTYPGLFVYNGLDNSSVPTVSSLYRNTGNGSFTQVTPYSIPPVSNQAIATSASWGDYDNDGYPDLFVTTFNPSYLYHNEGGGVFTQISTGDPVEDYANNNITGCTWADFDQDGFLDLFVTRFDPTFSSFCFLYRNNGDGTLTRVTDSALVSDIGSAVGCGFADYDNDGKIDVFICGGGGQSAPASFNRLYHNNGDGTFTRMTNASIGSIVTNLSHSGTCAWGDYDGDGFLDLFVVNINGERNFLYHNNGDGSFTQVTGQIVSNGPSGWFDIGNTPAACAWGDYDNDGFLDLLVTDSGNSEPFVNFLYHNNGDGTFTKVLSGSPVNEFSGSYGCSWVDYDNDGFLDLFASRKGGDGHALYHNNGNSNAWLTVKLIGTVSNRSAIGAEVRVRAFYRGTYRWQVRQISGGSGWLSHNESDAHFGLGDATNAETVRIEWPSGTVQEFHNVAPRQFLSITEPPRLLANTTNGVPQFLLKGGRFMQYDIQGSTNLTAWAPIETLTITNLSGLAEIIDPNTPADRKFYRAVSH